MPKKREFEETIKGKIDTYKHLIYGEEDMSIVTKVLEQVAKKRAKEEKAPDTPDSTKKRYAIHIFFVLLFLEGKGRAFIFERFFILYFVV